MKTFSQKPETPEELLNSLQHHGVKGMRWGVRKARPSRSEILGARQRQARREDDATNPKLSTAKRAKALKEFDTNEDRITALRLTRGEKFVSALVIGPLGTIVRQWGNKREIKNITKARKELTTKRATAIIKERQKMENR
jgi:hypothetical protein